MIDSISVDLMVKDGTIEIFPFLVESTVIRLLSADNTISI